MHVEDLGLLQAEDPEIFEKARQVEAVVITKDNDFVQILERRGPPPQVVWVTCGNRSNPALKDLIVRSWPRVRELLAAGEVLVEESDQFGIWRNKPREIGEGGTECRR